MQQVNVDLGARSYPIFIGTGLLGDEAVFRPALGAASLVVTSDAVAPLHLQTVIDALGHHPHATLTLEDGDPAKSLASVERIVAAAIAAGVARDGTFLALGGGAIGDVVGLAAALYHRGVGLIQVPTTLLAQVDSAVGGKTAVNHTLGKNLIGAFHQPRRVICDIGVLATLPTRQLHAGLAEVIKYALLEGDGAMADLEHALPALVARDPDALTKAVTTCNRIKAEIVAADETDHGRRGLLNLGHTFGHALETAYAGGLLHGEAVAIGCVMAARLSQTLGRLASTDYARIVRLFESAGLPVAPPPPTPSIETLLSLMRRDKKVTGGVIRLVLFRGLGDVEMTDNYPHASLVLTLRDFTMAG